MSSKRHTDIFWINTSAGKESVEIGTSSSIGSDFLLITHGQDYLNVVQRMKVWAHSAIALHAVQHSTRLLYETLVKPSASRNTIRSGDAPSIAYSCRNDPLLMRPWAVFLATLILWAHQHASTSHITMASSGSRYFEALDDQAMCCR